MAKGFGVKADQQLGYVLDLMPSAHAYAAKFSLDFRGEEGPFIGLTNILEDAQIWQRPKQARRAILNYYATFLLNQLQDGLEARVLIKRLKRSTTGELKTETVETLLYSAVDLKK
jgi:hypothetical protein